MSDRPPPRKPPQLNPFAPTLKVPAVRPGAEELLDMLEELVDPAARGDREPVTPVTLRPAELQRPRQGRILIIEDEQDIREVLRDALRGAGYIVREAADGVEGLAKITEPIPPDLVLLDVGLPRLSGRAVAAAMDADDMGIPRLIISASGDIRRLLERHPDWNGEFVFPKPLKLEPFLAKVEQRIAERMAMPRLPWRK